MDRDGLFALYTLQTNRPVFVGRIDAPLARAIGALTRAVWFSKDDMIKQHKKHRDVSFDHLLMIDIALKYGRAVKDSQNTLVFLYDDRNVFGTTIKVAVKSTGLGNELYAQSVHTLRARKVKNYLRRGYLLREHTP